MKVSSFCGGPFQTNGFFFESKDCSILFDAPEDIVDWVKADGKTIDVLVLTHCHQDHIEDVLKAISIFDCPVWAHSDPRDELTLRSDLQALTGMDFELIEFPVAKHLEPGRITIGEDIFEVLHVPGHSPDSLCFYHQEGQFLIGGDVLFRGGIGRTDFPNGDHDLLISGIKDSLWPLPAKTTVFPGHGPATTIELEKATNPFIR